MNDNSFYGAISGNGLATGEGNPRFRGSTYGNARAGTDGDFVYLAEGITEVDASVSNILNYEIIRGDPSPSAFTSMHLRKLDGDPAHPITYDASIRAGDDSVDKFLSQKFAVGPGTYHVGLEAGANASGTTRSFTGLGDSSKASVSVVAEMQFVPIDAVDVLRGATTVGFTGATIQALFQPKTPSGTPVRLSDLADALEVESFNWIQRVRRIPDHLTEPGNRAVVFGDTTYDEVVARLSGQNDNPDVESLGFDVQSLNVPFLDPAPNEEQVYGFFADRWHIVRQPAGQDNLPYYFSESEAESLSGDGVLAYEDTPSADADLMGDGFFQFDTMLAGVLDGGGYKTWSGIGTNFRWSTNAVNASGDTFFRNSQFENNFAPIVSGGVFDVEVDLVANAPSPIPEPTSLAIFSLGALCLLAGHCGRKLQESRRLSCRACSANRRFSTGGDNDSAG